MRVLTPDMMNRVFEVTDEIPLSREALQVPLVLEVVGGVAVPDRLGDPLVEVGDALSGGVDLGDVGVQLALLRRPQVLDGLVGAVEGVDDALALGEHHGAGTTGPPLRLGAAGELTVLTLQPPIVRQSP